MSNNESTTILKLVLLMGFVFLIIGLLPGGNTTAWTNFSNSIQNFPIFFNPFDTHIRSTKWLPTGAALSTASQPDGIVVASSGSYVTIGSNSGCSTTRWYLCLIDPNGTDRDLTLLKITGEWGDISPRPRLILGGTGDSINIRAISVNVWCKTVSSDFSQPVTLDAFLSENDPSVPDTDYAIQGGYGGVCPIGTFGQLAIPFLPVDYTTTSGRRLVLEWGQWKTCAPQCENGLGLEQEINSTVEFTTLTVDVTIADPTVGSCNTTDWFSNIGCQLAQFFSPAIKFLLLIGSGIAFGFLVLFWFIGIIIAFAGLITGFIAIISTWPSIIAGFFLVFFTGVFLFIAFVFMSRIRGTGTTG